jgi:hypothetical protein
MWENRVINSAVIVIQRKFRHFKARGFRQLLAQRALREATSTWENTRQDAAMWKAGQFHETEFIEKSAHVLNNIVTDLRRVARRSGISSRLLKSKGIDFDQQDSDLGMDFSAAACVVCMSFHHLIQKTKKAARPGLRAHHPVHLCLQRLSILPSE